MSPSVSRTLRAGLTVFVLAMLVLFATKVNWRDTWGAMRAASFPLLLFAAVLNIAAGVVKGIRWWVFLRPIGVTSLSLALRATFAGAGLNNVLIANGGEAARVIGMAFIARLVADKTRALDEWRLDNGALDGRARAEDDGERRGEREGTGDPPMPQFHDCEMREVRSELTEWPLRPVAPGWL